MKTFMWNIKKANTSKPGNLLLITFAGVIIDTWDYKESMKNTLYLFCILMKADGISEKKENSPTLSDL